MRYRPLLAFALAALVSPATGWGRPLTGVVEGYYGRPWTGRARRDVILYLGAHGMNTFVYAPKNDEYHRLRRRTPYPDAAIADLRATATTAHKARVRFVYALSPVLDVCYSCRTDLRALTAKLAQVARARVHRFALLFDDGGQLVAPGDLARYGAADDPAALARAQAELANRVARWLRARGLGRLVLVVPSDYAGNTCRPYHRTLARYLARGMPVGWTGSGVFSPTITGAEARARAACLPRHPVVLWDNYPANDTVLSSNLHLGPLTGRTPDLPRALGGYLANPMTQPHASLVALGTVAAYLRAPVAYDAKQAWQAALAEAGGGGTGLGVLAAQVRSSALDLNDAVALGAAVDGLAAAYDSPSWMPAVEALDAEEARQVAAPDDIASRLGGTPLAEEIAPWVTDLVAHSARGLAAAALLRALKPTLIEIATTRTPAGLRLQGHARAADASTAAALGPDMASEATAVAARIARPRLAAFLACLGDLQGGDIAFCPSFGLNVHGKELYVIIHDPDLSDLVVVSDRNVHERLVLFAGAAYTAWAARRTPGADTLTLLADDVPIPLAGDGTFDTTLAGVSGPVTLLLRTAAGEETAHTPP